MPDFNKLSDSLRSQGDNSHTKVEKIEKGENRGETVETVEEGQFNPKDLFLGLFSAINRTTKKIMAEKTHCSKVWAIFNHLFNALCHNAS